MHSKSLIQFSVDGWGCVPSLLFTWGQAVLADNGYLLQTVPCMHCYTQRPQPCSRPPLANTSTGDSWTLTGKSAPVSCGVTTPFSWVLVLTRFCLYLPRVCFPVLCEFRQLYGGVNDDLLQEVLMPYPGLLHPEPLRQSTADPYLHRRHSNTVCLSLYGVS